MKVKELLLGAFATLVLLSSGIAIGVNYKPTYQESDTQVMVLARGVGEAVGLLNGHFNCGKGVRSVHLTPTSTIIGCAKLNGETVEITEETGTLMDIPKEMFKPFK